MLYAVDAVPAYQQVAYEVAPARVAGTAQGSAAADRHDISSGSTTDTRIHCVASNASHGDVVICDNATIISLASDRAPRSTRGTPAVLREEHLRPTSVSLAPSSGPQEAADVAQALDGVASPTRRWIADLLMTAGIGFLLISFFLFVTSRIPNPSRAR